MPVAITVVVDGLLVFLYLNGREALDQPKRLSDYAAEAQPWELETIISPGLFAATCGGKRLIFLGQKAIRQW